jgi:hypothetical protein
MVAPKIYSVDALWLVSHAVLFSALIDDLDPKFITTTKICVGEDSASVAFREILSLNDNGWLNQMLIGIPIIETRKPLPLDVVAVAALKALAGHIGARGESRIRNVGIGLGEGEALGEPLMVEAIWCEASLLESVTETGQNSRPRLSSVHEITGITAPSTDMAMLSAALSLHGASAISFHLVQREKNSSGYLMRFLVSDEDKRDALEAFLIKGGALDVSVALVERHELNRRLVSVPIGTGNKASAVRFFEYVFFDKTVRVEPIKEDLDQYVLKTDYSVDVARSDLLLAWKKWRGRVVSEDA